jgi:hypothetical protein
MEFITWLNIVESLVGSRYMVHHQLSCCLSLLEFQVMKMVRETLFVCHETNFYIVLFFFIFYHFRLFSNFWVNCTFFIVGCKGLNDKNGLG